ASGELPPHNGFHLDVEIDFDCAMIGRQRIEIDLNPGSFRRELSRARTFGFMKDVERLWAAGLALGASLENTVAIGDDRIINREGLRYSDEFVRHKALDAVGDLALAGAPILGSLRPPPRRPSPEQPRAESAVRRCRGLDAGRSSAVVPRGSPCRAQPPPGRCEFRRRAKLTAKPPSDCLRLLDVTSIVTAPGVSACRLSAPRPLHT